MTVCNIYAPREHHSLTICTASSQCMEVQYIITVYYISLKMSVQPHSMQCILVVDKVCLQLTKYSYNAVYSYSTECNLSVGSSSTVYGEYLQCTVYIILVQSSALTCSEQSNSVKIILTVQPQIIQHRLSEQYNLTMYSVTLQNTVKTLQRKAESFYASRSLTVYSKTKLYTA